MSSLSNKNSFINYRHDIDGLRAIAVLAVIINHFDYQILPGGFLGVDIFFVISGFVITASLYKRRNREFNLKSFLSSFYKRRLQRLLPILLLFIFLTSIAVFAFIPADTGVLTIRAGMSSIFGLSNIYFIKRSLDYFDTSAILNPFTHTWSLAVEEQFYLLYPLITWFAGFSRNLKNGRNNLIKVLLFLTTVSWLLYCFLNYSNQSLAYFLLPSRFWEISIGCLIFLIFNNKIIGKFNSYNFKQSYFLFPLVLVMFIPNNFSTITTTLIVLLTSLIILSNKNSEKENILTNKNIVYLGKISYSLYLWHWPLIWLTRITLGINIASIIFSSLLIFICSVISYHFIEDKIRRSKVEKLFLKASLSSTFLFAGLFLSTKYLSKRIYNFVNFDFPLDEKLVDANLAYKSCKEIDHLEKRTELSKNTIYIFGDSHATTYECGIKKNLVYSEIKNFTTSQGCAYLPMKNASRINTYNIFSGSVFRCSDYINKIDNIVDSEINNNDVVFLGIDWTKGGRKKNIKNLDLSIYDLARRVTDKKAYFVLMGDVPDTGEPFICKKAWYRKLGRNCKTPLSVIEKKQFSLDEIGHNLTNKFKNAKYLILRESLCGETNFCGSYINDDFIWMDQGHITDYAAEKYTSKEFKKILDEIYGENNY